MGQYRIISGDSSEELKKIPDNSIDAVVTDPPAGIGFMGKEWDKDKGGRDEWIKWMQVIATEVYRTMKPGAHALVWALPRTSHWTAMAWENAGFQIRDVVAHVFGSGFPKSHDVSKAIDREAGAEREVVGKQDVGPDMRGNNFNASIGRMITDITAPATREAKQWEGWGTALKPSREDWILLRKPIVGTVAQNVLKYGTGALNIDGCRVGTDGGTSRSGQADYPKNADGTEDRSESWARTGHGIVEINAGRFPANLIHDGSEEVVSLFPDTKSGKMGPQHTRNTNKSPNGIYGKFDIDHPLSETYGDSGSAARFFYVAKASKRDRDEGCEGLEDHKAGMVSNTSGQHITRRDEGYEVAPRRNHHPTVKPTALMTYLCRLITPPGGTILDPFMGSGSTGKAAILEGFNFIGIEREPEYVAIAEARISHVTKESPHKSAPKPIITEPKPEKLTKSPQLSLF